MNKSLPMKTSVFFKSAIVIVSLFCAVSAGAQCTADAGPDVVVCSELLGGVIPTTIGGNPTATGGIPPYTYKWEAYYVYVIGTHTYYFFASDYLDDTTLANPAIIHGNYDSLVFHVTVTDANSNVCTDQVQARYSNFGATLEDKRRDINRGDSVQLYSGLFGNLQPLSYHWEPNYRLSDPNSPHPWAKPDTSTSYINTATDAGGCQATDMDAFEVYVIPEGTTSHVKNANVITIHPNPLTVQSAVHLAVPIRNTEIQFYNILGRKEKVIIPAGSSFSISKTDFKEGMYIYRVLQQGMQIAVGKLIVE
jgi:hypothetical protein